MEREWQRQVVENLTAEDLSKQKHQDFDPKENYESVTEKIKEKRKTDSGFVYTDESFPPVEASLSYTHEYRASLPQIITWRRPYMMSKAPSFMKDGFSRDDVIQGQLGNCYLLSSLATVAHRTKMIKKCVPSDQKLGFSDEYTGAFHFRFWQFGTWYDIVIDDWIPSITTHHENVIPISSRSRNPNEFWICLAEKAYAKLHTSYEAIGRGGSTQDALEDLTGGLAVKYDFKDFNDKTITDFERHMRKAVRNRSFVSMELFGDGNYDKASGLASHHSYSVTLAELIKVGNEKISLFRIRNPWGSANYEWKLKWSDDDLENWSRLSDEDKKKLEYPAGEGEWYMCYEDITRHFSNVIICTTTPDFDQDGVQDKNGYFYSYAKGRWSGNNSGGSFNNNQGWFAINPQYLIKVLPFDTDKNEDGLCAVAIGLMQRYRLFQLEDREPWSIGYRFYEVPSNFGEYLLANELKIPYGYFDQLILMNAFDDCKVERELSFFTDLEPEKYYLFVPFTKYQSQEEDFLVRVYSEEKIRLVELL